MRLCLVSRKTCLICPLPVATRIWQKASVELPLIIDGASPSEALIWQMNTLMLHRPCDHSHTEQQTLWINSHCCSWARDLRINNALSALWMEVNGNNPDKDIFLLLQAWKFFGGNVLHSTCSEFSWFGGVDAPLEGCWILRHKWKPDFFVRQ